MHFLQKVTKIASNEFDTSTEQGSFLRTLAKKGGCGIINLDTRDCVIREDQALGVFSLIQSIDPNVPFTLLFNGSGLREHVSYQYADCTYPHFRSHLSVYAH